MSEKTPDPERARSFLYEVHGYYAHYVDNADAKAGAVLGFAVAVGGVAISVSPDGDVAALLRWVAIAALAVAVAVAANVLYPRLYRRGGSLIFWEDVRNYGSGGSYYKLVSALTPEDLARAYADQVFQVSRVLHRKFSALQWAVSALTVGIAAIGLAAVIG